ncbi:hypothetical protein HU200_040658 [Digitaria exilis]|uniref:Uncharacterized protein n=1 Tax=Digitaria exilis TaxID=1010633 RepID=A0A835B7X1_9POAL|nr:hypothetical protein HU200_040658 [Digitaria exilis]
MDAKGLTPILLDVLLACTAFYPAKCEGGDSERSPTTATGGLRRRPDGEETMTVGSDKFYIELCVKTKCDPGNKRCYCCKAVPVERCFWGQQECWDYCPNRQQLRVGSQLPAPATGTIIHYR